MGQNFDKERDVIASSRHRVIANGNLTTVAVKPISGHNGGHEEGGV